MRLWKKSITFLLLIFLIGAVSAADEINSTNIGSIEVDEQLEVENEGTFSDLSNEISKTTCELNITKDYSFNFESDQNLTKGISIYKKDLVINGNNHCIDAKGQSSIFNIFDSGITINNLTFKNAKGNAIYANYTDISTNNVIFANNDGDHGAAICGYNCEYISSNDKFIDNYAKNGASIFLDKESTLKLNNGDFKSSKELYWGLIYLSDTVMSISNTEFVNVSSRYSPAIFGDGAKGQIKNCRFTNLTANITGGAIAFVNTEEKINLENCSFINCSSKRNGGAIFSEMIGEDSTQILTISNSKFINCSCEFGGAVLHLGGFVNIYNSDFINNTAKYQGGAIYINNAYATHIHDSNFLGNKLENNSEESNHGSAIFVDSNPDGVEIKNSNFTNNQAQYCEAIYLYDCIYKIANSYFKGNGENIYTVFDKEDCELRNNNYVDGSNKINQKDYVWVFTGNNTFIELNPMIIDESYINNTYFNLGDFGLKAPIKNQMGTENCWAFGTSTMLHLALLKATNLTLNSSFSINNIVFNSKKYSRFGESSIYVDGGDAFSASYYFLSWFGGFLNEDDSDFDEIGRISNVNENADKFHLHNFVAIPKIEDTHNINVYKQALVKYGALAVTVNAPNSLIKDDYNNKTHGSYYYVEPDPFSGGGDSNHIVVLVGWNDTYSKDNFLVTPPGDGAWIIQNSWGEEWGDNGYYYVSYYDTAFATLSSPVSFIIDENYPYTKNYQYDFSLMEFDYEYAEEVKAYANIYESIDDDLIASVGTYFNAAGMDYTIVISVNGVEAYSQSGKSSFRGYQTIKLDKYVSINKGDKFRVEIKSKFAPVYRDSRNIIPSGVSFIDSGEGFEDISANGAFVSIKAYTISNPISTNNSIKYFSDETPFIVMVEPNDEVTFEINGIKATVRADENGTARIGINLHPGSYTIDVEYNNTKMVYIIQIKNTIVSQDVSRGYNSNYNYKVQILDSTGRGINNTDVKVTINGKAKQYKTDANGFITIPFTKLTANQVIGVVNPSNNEVSKNTIKVVSRFSGNKNINMYYFDGTKFTVKVYGDDARLVGANQVVTIKLNKKTYKVKTNSGGVATLKIPNTIKPGTYTIQSTYKGQTVKNTVKVKQVLTSKKTVSVKKSAKKLILKATLKNGKKALKGKKITFKFNGKTYKAKTNKKGVAKVTVKKNVIKKLKKGKKYSVKITYLKNYIKTSVKVKS